MSGRWRQRLGAALLLALLLVAGPIAAQTTGEPVALADFQARLAEADAVMREHPGPDAEAVAAARAALSPVAAVRLPSGEIVNIFEPLLPAEIERPAAAARITLLRDQVAVDRNEAARLAALGDVLARPEFFGLHQDSLWRRFQAWLGDLLAVLPWPEDTGGLPQAPVGTDWAVAAAIGVVVALLLGYWLRGILGNFVVEAEERRRQEAGEETPLTSAAAREQATALAQTGAYRLAVRALYLSALLRLEEGGLLRADRSLTNHEHLAETAGNPALHDRLEPVVRAFDEVWYGVREPDRQTFERYQDDVAALNEVVR